MTWRIKIKKKLPPASLFKSVRKPTRTYPIADSFCTCRRSANRISACGLHSYINSISGGSFFLFPMPCIGPGSTTSFLRSYRCNIEALTTWYKPIHHSGLWCIVGIILLVKLKITKRRLCTCAIWWSLLLSLTFLYLSSVEKFLGLLKR